MLDAHHESTLTAEYAFAYQTLVGVGDGALHSPSQLLEVRVLRLLYLHVLFKTVVVRQVSYHGLVSSHARLRRGVPAWQRNRGKEIRLRHRTPIS